MKTFIIAASVIFSILIGMYNGWIFRFHFSRDVRDNRIVHRLGGSIRAFWLFAVLITGILAEFPFRDIVFISLLNAVLIWPVFDLLYNLVNTKPWNYSGSKTTSSWIDRLIYRFDEWLKLLLILATVTWLPLWNHRVIHERGIELGITAGIFITFGYIAWRFHHKGKVG